jgi:hypothetical protein
MNGTKRKRFRTSRAAGSYFLVGLIVSSTEASGALGRSVQHHLHKWCGLPDVPRRVGFSSTIENSIL